MKKKILIIVLFQNLLDEKPYYAKNPSPPLPGLLLAGMTPDIVDVEVLHEMVRPINYKTDADFIALSFMDYIAPHAFEVASKFKSLGKIVVGGGKFISTFPEIAEKYFDSVLIGEAQNVWNKMVYDMVEGNLKKRYYADPSGKLINIPPPRYDLAEKKFTAPIVTEASRGCPHPCTYCQLNIAKLPYRTRPVADVINDLSATHMLPWYKRKMAMIVDNNLGGDLPYAKSLLREIAKLKYWAIGVQFSIECLRDNEFIELLNSANCRMAFIGMESLNPKSLKGVNKMQNKVNEYKEAFTNLHKKGILTFTGLMFALDEDDMDYYKTLPDKLDEVGVAVVLPSISIPIYGTPWYRQVKEEGRIIDFNISHYEGDHVLFKHKKLTEEEIYSVYTNVNKIFFSFKKILIRWWHIIKIQERKDTILAFTMNLILISFIYFKLSIFQRHHAQKRVFTNNTKNCSSSNKRLMSNKINNSAVIVE